MKHLWAPWRMIFLSGKRPKGCVFCTLPKKKNDRENLIVYRGKNSFVILNKYPYNNGHLMVVPNQHTNQLNHLNSETLTEMMALADLSMKIFKQAMKAEGFNVGMNFGLSGGAGIPGHLHIHVVPRWLGDTNFMPILSETKVMVEYLHDTYDRLYPLFHNQKRAKAKKERIK